MHILKIPLLLSVLSLTACERVIYVEVPADDEDNIQSGITDNDADTDTDSDADTDTDTDTDSDTDTDTDTDVSVENPRVDNPYLGVDFYINEDYADKIASSKALVDASWHDAMDTVAAQHTAVWIDRTAAIEGSAEVMGVEEHLDEAVRKLAEDPSRPMLITFVVYNLPNRDCAALASNGELRLENDGMRKYKEEYIDEIVSILGAKPEYESLRIVTVIEPDSLPNMVTNLEAFPDCRVAQPAYEEGIAYAIEQLSTLDNVYIYLDIAHSAWLGWEHGDNAAAQYKKVLEMAGGEELVQGFATNVSNYSTLRETFNPFDNVNANQGIIIDFYEWNRVIDERTFVAQMRDHFPNHGFVIDTGRNGWPDNANGPRDGRTHRGNWCNVDGAGIGELPTPAPATGIDAYVWIKPPGESDGTSDSSATTPNEEGKRYDAMCGQSAVYREIGEYTIPTDALPNAPHAGGWFHEQFMMLVENANPPLR